MAEALMDFHCPYCRVDCSSQGRYSAHLRFGHGVLEVSTAPDVPYRAHTLREIGLPSHDNDGIASPFEHRTLAQQIDDGDVLNGHERIPTMDGGAILSVDAKTGAAKGVKLARFDLVPMDALIELAEHYGKGEAKYPSDPDGTPNWSKGYAWSKSTQAAMRHLAQFIGGEDIDEETGQKHVIAVAWHMFALARYMNTKTGTDDRWQA